MDIDTKTNDLNTAITDTAQYILGKERRIKQPWMTRELLEKCDRRRELEIKKGSTEGAAMYRLINKEIKKGMREAKEKWIGDKCKEIEDNLERNNSKRAYQVVKELTNERKTITNVIKDKSGKSLTEENAVIKRWTEYCSELYNYEANGDPTVLNFTSIEEEESLPILRTEVKAEPDH